MLVYYFTSATHALSNVRLQRLKISDLENLNDPFEWAAPALERPEDRWALQATRKEMSKTTGMICFSQNWRNPVQWAHYADRHRGICMGLEVQDNMLTKVKYRDERSPGGNLEELLEQRKLDHSWMIDVISTKFAHWAYEEEHRAFLSLDPATEEDGMYFKSFGDDMRLVQLIVGAKSLVTRQELADALGPMAPKVRCKKARLAFKTYEVCEQLDERRWR
ncbi:MAG TPA: DUF2971 domain-containing protein [Hydrogenophaga sp.]|uniref:DUF2971 domain-containing protein n=1 Tax=Hydrogenophaga sp. TaxID=1904254 RepID=UPI002D16A4B9|nr:DUF2971 domain-containing protein [Hydrogenophaga sp.]HSX95144.1 DUF2971 domain-containing protein [Hydrogenophaga sp.]